MKKLIIPLLLALAAVGTVWVAASRTTGSPESARKPDRPAMDQVSARGVPAPAREVPAPARLGGVGQAELAPEPTPTPRERLALEVPDADNALRNDLLAWANRHHLSDEQQRAVISAIADARDNRDIEERVASREARPRADRDVVALRAHAQHVRSGATVAPQLYADVERITASKAAAAEFETMFGDVLVMLFLSAPKPAK